MSASLVFPAPLPAANLLFREVRALDPRQRLDEALDLRVRKGIVAELAPAATLTPDPEEEVVEGGGRCLLCPAFFDPHVHLRTPGQEHKEDLRSGTKAAAAGGYWAVLALANTAPPLDNPLLLAGLRSRAEAEAVVGVGFFATVSEGLGGARLSEMAALREAGAVGFSDDGKPLVEGALLRDALRYQRLVGGVVALHEEDPSLATGVVREGPVSGLLGLPPTPAYAESALVARDLQIVRAEGGRVHLLHLSAKDSVAELERAKGEGLAVSAEVTPHHLLLDEERVLDLDSALRVNPPLGNRADREALLGALRKGTIDCIATDHAPHAPEEKEVPFEQAPPGTTGLEVAFAALYTHLVLPGLISLPLLLERLGAGAALYGVAPAQIKVGETASLTLIDLEERFVAGAEGWQSKATNCAFAGCPLQGRILLTVSRGRVAFRLARTRERLWVGP